MVSSAEVDFVEFKATGIIRAKAGSNDRKLYVHQAEAMHCLDLMNKQASSFSTLIVMPTGAGKTYTAVNWLLKNAVDQKKKVIV